MNITKRFKNSKGDIVAYELENNGVFKVLKAHEVKLLADFITNAKLLKNGEFRANDGCSIETFNAKSSINVHKKNKIITVSQSTQECTNPINEVDCYGKRFINACKEIRNYAVKGMIRVDTSVHGEGRGKNKNLFELIKMCGISVDYFVAGYLSTIQPYSLKPFQPEKAAVCDTSLWLCNIGYNITMIIKLDKSNLKYNKPLVISFHESYKADRYTAGRKDFSDKKCAVIVDTVNQVGNAYKVIYHVQRGFLRLKVTSFTTQYYKEVALVNYADIKSEFDTSMNAIFTAMRSSYTDTGTLEEITKIDSGVLSFMSFGYATINNVCLAIDLYNKYTDTSSILALLEIITNITSDMTNTRQAELKIALKQKFGELYENKLYNTLIGMLPDM